MNVIKLDSTVLRLSSERTRIYLGLLKSVFNEYKPVTNGYT